MTFPCDAVPDGDAQASTSDARRTARVLRTILVAEDDPDDRELVQAAFSAAGVAGRLDFVEDGVDLLNYLQRSGAWQDHSPGALPDLVLVDLNMPRVDGRQALAEIRADPALRRLPVVVLSTSSDPVDIDRCYDLGANAFLSKPADFGSLVEMIRATARFWFDAASLPAVPR